MLPGSDRWPIHATHTSTHQYFFKHTTSSDFSVKLLLPLQLFLVFRRQIRPRNKHVSKLRPYLCSYLSKDEGINDAGDGPITINSLLLIAI